jgi:hypothetical protein
VDFDKGHPVGWLLEGQLGLAQLSMTLSLGPKRQEHIN